MKCTPKIAVFPKNFSKKFSATKKPPVSVGNRRHKYLKLFDFQFLFLCEQHFQKDFIYCVGVSSLYYEVIFQIDKRLYHSTLLIIGEINMIFLFSHRLFLQFLNIFLIILISSSVSEDINICTL